MDATVCSDVSLREAAGLFLDESKLGPFAFEKCSGGVNNMMYYVSTAKGDRFVMRVYNNGGNAARVRYEHDILRFLETSSFFFSFPRLVLSRDGTTSVQLQSMNAEACMFHLLPGAPAKVNSQSVAKSAGKATALLVAKLSEIEKAPSCPNPLFRHPYQACPGRVLAPEEVRRILSGPEFDHVREQTSFLLAELERVSALAAKTVLPEQQIHADAHLDNFLAVTDPQTQKDVVSAVIDFEFAAWDWRCMELAVALTKFVATEGIDIKRMIEKFIGGYFEAGGRLSEAECEFLPDGMILRIISNVTFFAGRATATPPQDNIQTLVKKVVPYYNRIKWLQANGAWLVDVAKRKLIDKK